MIYKNEEEMKEKLQEEMKEARNNVRKDRIRITLKRFLTVIIIFSIIIAQVLYKFQVYNYINKFSIRRRKNGRKKICRRLSGNRYSSDN